MTTNSLDSGRGVSDAFLDHLDQLTAKKVCHGGGTFSYIKTSSWLSAAIR